MALSALPLALPLLLLLSLANGVVGESMLEFEYSETVRWSTLGPSVSAGNGLYVAYNGSHTHVMNTSTLPSSTPVEDAVYWAWRPIKTNIDGLGARKNHAMSSLGNGKVLMYGGVDDNNKILNDAYIFALSTDAKTGEEIVNWTQTADGPSARAGHAMSSLGNGKILMYGGGSDNGHAYIFSLSTNTKTGEEIVNWTQTVDGPSARVGHALSSLGNDKVVLYGGFNANIHFALNDAYIFSLFTNEENGEEKGAWKRVQDGPSARVGHALSSLGNDKVVLYGGFDRGSYLNDAYTFALSTGTWLKIKHGPSARQYHAMTSLENGKLLMYSGYDTNYKKLNDAYIFAQETGTWTRTKDGASPRKWHAMSSLGNDGRVVMYGGTDLIGNHLNDAYIFSLPIDAKTKEKTGTWIKAADGPRARQRHAMCSLGNDGVLMYGGFDYPNYLNDVYIFTLSTSEETGEETGTWIKAADGPSARQYHAMSSLGNGQVLMYGGFDGSNNAFNDAHIFALSTDAKIGEEVGAWTKISDGPSARANHAMSSLGDGKVLMYGGYDANYKKLNDASIFELSTNKETGKETGAWRRTKDGPSARESHAMSSLGNGKVVMYGGVNCNDTPLNDVWMYSGGNQDLNRAQWSPLSQSVKLKRSDHAMATLLYSNVPSNANTPTRFVPVVFGGQVSADWWDEKKHATKSITNSLQNDIWIMPLSGCPPGSHGKSCDLCAKNQWKDSLTNETTSCTSCPLGTTTGVRGATAENQCVLCVDYNILLDHNAACSVDTSTFLPVWRCFGKFGPECENECPGGATNPCDGHGECDVGVKGNGTCTCQTLYFGTDCKNQCECKHGTCDDGVYGTGACTCDSNYYGDNCEEECDCNHGTCDTVKNGTCTCDALFFGRRCDAWTAVVSICVIILAAIVISGTFYSLRRYFKKELIIQDHEFQLLDSRYSETTKERDSYKQGRVVNYSDINFNSGKIIGQGAFGKVWKGRWRGVDVAVKKMFPAQGDDAMFNSVPMTSSSTYTTERFSNGMNEIARNMLNELEVEAMMQFSHPRIVAFLGAGQIVDPPLEGNSVPRVGIFVMLQFCAGGDLSNRLTNANGSLEIFPWRDRLQCALDIAEGMAYVHQMGYIHRDLKSLNVLCDEDGRCLIADLGLAKKVIDSSVIAEIEAEEKSHLPLSPQATSMKGTAAWMAPEVTTTVYDNSVDVFSFGVLMWELITGRMPWAGAEYNWVHTILDAVAKGKRPGITKEEMEHVPEGYLELMNRCWDGDSKERPSFDQAVSELQRIMSPEWEVQVPSNDLH